MKRGGVLEAVLWLLALGAVGAAVPAAPSSQTVLLRTSDGSDPRDLAHRRNPRLQPSSLCPADTGARTGKGWLPPRRGRHRHWRSICAGTVVQRGPAAEHERMPAGRQGGAGVPPGAATSPAAASRWQGRRSGPPCPRGRLRRPQRSVAGAAVGESYAGSAATRRCASAIARRCWSRASRTHATAPPRLSTFGDGIRELRLLNGAGHGGCLSGTRSRRSARGLVSSDVAMIAGGHHEN
jgi:hypothetical protein